MFLTLEDPRAKIQGSRDPLGVQPIWSGFGRRLVSNLTTVSNSVRGFTVLLMGRYFGELLIGNGRAEEQDALSIFLRTEQLCGYARYCIHDAEDTRGIERIRRNLAEGRTVLIDDNADGWILSDQKTYGLWGLFSVAARVSGLLKDGPVGLTDAARDFVEQEYIARLESVLPQLTRMVQDGASIEVSKRNAVMKAIGAAMPPQLSHNEIEFYGGFLRDATLVPGQSAHQQQQLLASKLESETDLADWIGRREIVALIEACNREDSSLARALANAARLEALLAPADLIFDHMLTRHGQTPATVARSFRDRWGSQVPNLEPSIEELLPDIEKWSTHSLATGAKSLDDALHEGDYEEAIRTLLGWNHEVMSRRNAAPWVTLSDGALDVRYRGTESELPTGDELPFVWRNSYFLNSLKDVTAQIAGTS